MMRTTTGLLIGTALVALVGWIWISVHFTVKREAMASDHMQRVRLLKAQWRGDRRNRMAEYHAELETAWGGGIKAAGKDPDLDIAGMLRMVAMAVCPHSANVEVEVDNFNEFDVFIDVTSPLERESAAAAAKAFLTECSKYVNSVSFVSSGLVAKTIDKRGIDGIPDWSRIDLNTVGNAMYTP